VYHSVGSSRPAAAAASDPKQRPGGFSERFAEAFDGRPLDLERALRERWPNAEEGLKQRAFVRMQVTCVL
jgi:hypothetical protein